MAACESGAYNEIMLWEVEYTEEFREWWIELTSRQQDAIESKVDMLSHLGPDLGYPHTSAIHGSRYSHMRELRVPSGRGQIRIFYAMDPRRTSILLIGGDKTGNDRFYEEYVPIADRLYEEYLEELRMEGLI